MIEKQTPIRLKNKIRCKQCFSVLESKHRHDFVVCKCWGTDNGIFLDGGDDYYRCGGNLANILVINEDGTETSLKLREQNDI